MVTWPDLLASRLIDNGETLDDIVAWKFAQGHDKWTYTNGSIVWASDVSFPSEEFLVEFDDDYGSSQGIPFYVWTKEFVYFPGVYDGSEWVDSVPRNPREDGPPPCHVGGE